jgi:hypothetical protein
MELGPMDENEAKVSNVLKRY